MDPSFEKHEHKFKELSIHLNQRQKEQLMMFYSCLIEKNKVMNLTTITDFDEVVEKHFIDSMSIVKLMDLQKQMISVLDMGTGAGFPGIPLKIVFPDLKMTLADSLNKRIHFLDEVIQTLELDNIETVHGRAEDLALIPTYREQYDLCISRAVANLSTLSEYCLPFVKQGGWFVAYKSGEYEKELQDAKKAVALLGGSICDVTSFCLEKYERSLIRIEKKEKTKNKYPRKAGIPAKKPL